MSLQPGLKLIQNLMPYTIMSNWAQYENGLCKNKDPFRFMSVSMYS